MKVVHLIAGNLNEGAAKGAYGLHRGLLNQSIESRILTNSKILLNEKEITYVVRNFKSKLINYLRYKVDQACSLMYHVNKKYFFSTGLIGYDILEDEDIKSADIIHLHWINGGFINIKQLKKLNKPIIWTLRDMWSFTGGCHYSLNCENYKHGCGKCYILNSKTNLDISRYICKQKEKYYPKDMEIVAISTWLSSQAKKSKIFKDFNIQTIVNSINTKDFYPIEKQKSKEILKVETDKNIILIGATNINDSYKGFSKFIESLQYLDKKRYFICFFGNLDTMFLDKFDFEFKQLGYLNDVNILRAAYSLCDVFIAPSIMEAFGKTLVEAMSCATPVVCFDATGPKDIVTHKFDGYKAKAFDSKDLANGINWVTTNDKKYELSTNARSTALLKFDNNIVAKQYIELYKKVLSE